VIAYTCKYWNISVVSVVFIEIVQHNQQYDTLLPIIPCRHKLKAGIAYSEKICKQSLWLDYKKKGSSNPVAWLASFLLIVQSEGFVYKSFVNFNLQFVRVGCKLFRAICLSKLQYCETILQCCSQENIRFDCKGGQLPPPRNRICPPPPPDIDPAPGRVASTILSAEKAFLEQTFSRFDTRITQPKHNGHMCKINLIF
jgi:hypothetical protein